MLDLFSRKIVGWDMSSQIDASLVERALRMALYQRQPLHHSDRGVQYASLQIRDILAANQISGKGNYSNREFLGNIEKRVGSPPEIYNPVSGTN